MYIYIRYTKERRKLEGKEGRRGEKGGRQGRSSLPFLEGRGGEDTNWKP